MIQVDPTIFKSGEILIWFEIINQNVAIMQGSRNNTSPLFVPDALPVVGAPIKVNLTGAVIVVEAS